MHALHHALQHLGVLVVLRDEAVVGVLGVERLALAVRHGALGLRANLFKQILAAPAKKSPARQSEYARPNARVPNAECTYPKSPCESRDRDASCTCAAPFPRRAAPFASAASDAASSGASPSCPCPPFLPAVFFSCVVAFFVCCCCFLSVFAFDTIFVCCTPLTVFTFRITHSKTQKPKQRRGSRTHT